jgi:hypothetical protein
MPSISDAVQSATASAQAAAGSALSGVSGATQAAQAALAPNAWVGAADNKLATADPYNPPNGPSVITDIENLFQKFDFSITDVLRGGKFIAQEAGAVMSGFRSAMRVAGQIQRGVTMLSQGDVMSRILGASLLTKGALNGLGVVGLGNIANSINAGISTAEGTVGQAYGQVSNQIYANLNGVVQQVSSAYAEGMGALGQCINSLGVNANFSINDVGVKIGLFSGLIQTSAGYGIPDSFGSLVATITDRNVLGQITMKVMPSIIHNADVGSLASIGARLGAGTAYAYNPNVIADFSQSYFIPPPASQGSQVDYSTCFTNLTNAYNSIDPNWSTYARQTTVTNTDGSTSTVADNAFNLNTVMNGSDDFKAVISQGAQASTDRNDKIMALAGVIKQTTVADKLAAQFPMTVFSGNNQQSNDVQDPLALATGTATPIVPTGYSNVAPNTGTSTRTVDPNTINPDTGEPYDLSDPGVTNKNGYYIWPNGHFQIGGTYTNKDTGEGYVAKNITFN